MEEAKLIKHIEHYQKNVERYLGKNEDAKILHCIQRLSGLPIEVTHLQKTGVGRTVNGLRKLAGEVGETARSLVAKWKDMVTQDGEESEPQEKQNSSHSSEDCSGNESQSSRCDQDDDDDEAKEKEKSRKYDKRKHDDKRRREEKEESKRKEEMKRREAKEESRRREEKEKREQELKRKEQKDEKRRLDEKEESRRRAEDAAKNGSKRKREDDVNGHSKQKKSLDESRTSSKSSSSSSSSSSKHKRSSDHKSKDDKKRRTSSSDKKESSSGAAKAKKVEADDGIDCESGTSFADALMMHTPSVKANSSSSRRALNSSSSSSSSSFTVPKSSMVSIPKSSGRLEGAPSTVALPVAPLPEKLEMQDISIGTMLPSISTNYKPLGNNTFRELDLNSKAKKVHDDEALSRLMYAKNQRTKVYSGNKVAFGRLPSLFEMCTRVLQDNIDALEYTGGVPYTILKPVLDKATPHQLFTLEYHNPYIMDDSDELWTFHCQKEFRGKKRQEMETCRDMYMRCLNERETKLRDLTANIKLSQDKSLPVRQTKLAYVDSVVKPPRNVAKKQFRNDVDSHKKPMITPSSRLNAIAAAGAAGHVSVPNHVTERTSSSASSSYSKPQKKAPLMAKTLQLMKGRFRR